MFKKSLVNLLVVLSLLLSMGLGVANAAPPAQAELTYTVKLGDNLWTLAEKYLGSGAAYHAIVMATNAKTAEDSSFASIADANLIQPGWKFLVPSAAEADDLMTARNEGPKFKVGMVSDVGGMDDASFNENTWKGVTDAASMFGIDIAFLESQAQADYENNITELAEQGYDLIIGVGFLLMDAIHKMAREYPDINFAGVDFSSFDWATTGEVTPNVQGMIFNVNEASFPVGYVAAAMADQLDPDGPSVGVVGGMQIPPVEEFIVAYEAGTNYYNQKYGKNVGFSVVYVGDFEAPDQGKIQGNALIDDGADVIMGVGGKTGNGGIVAAKERGKYGVGVDVDQYYTLPNEKDILVTSTMKRLDKAVLAVIQNMLAGKFGGGTDYLATLANQGVGVGPFHDFEDKVPDNIKADIAQIQAEIIAGKRLTGWPVPTAPAEGELGSAEAPIQVLFVPSVDAGMIVSGGEVMADALTAATGLSFEVSVPTSYAATIEAMCASPEDTMGLIPGFGYVLANQKCGVEVAMAAERYGWSVYWAQFLVPRDSDYQTLEDLAGKKWAVPDLASTSGFLFPSVMFQEAGIEPGEVIEAGGHPQAALAVYNGEVDFATTYFSAPLTDPAWKPGDDPEPFDPFDVILNEAGRTYAGDVRVLDARTAVMETAPDIFQKVRIMMLTDAIPNDTMSFGPDFPDALKGKIIAALAEFMQTDACQESLCSDNFYSWTGMDPIDDAAYDVIRRLMQGLGYTEEDIFN